jgi:hypothetical protein
MRELGYVEGTNITIEWRFADGRAERLPALAAELVAQRPDLIVSASTQAIEAAKAATATIPVIFTANADPVGAGFVKSLSRPGTNMTGLSTVAADLGAKQIELLRAILPRLSRIALLVNPTNAGNVQVIRSFQTGAREAYINPDRSIEILGKVTASKRSFLEASTRATLSLLGPGCLKTTEWARFGGWMYAHDLMKQRVAASDVMTRRFLGFQCKNHATV